jgi:hypothetical protein
MSVENELDLVRTLFRKALDEGSRDHLALDAAKVIARLSAEQRQIKRQESVTITHAQLEQLAKQLINCVMRVVQDRPGWEDIADEIANEISLLISRQPNVLMITDEK